MKGGAKTDEVTLMKRTKLSFMVALSVICVMGCSTKTADDLIKDLDSDNPTTRLIAGTKLMDKRGDKKVSSKLVGLLTSDNKRLVFLAVQILGSYPDTTLVEPIAAMLKDQNYGIREAAARSLGSIGHENAFPYLAKALDDSASAVRHAAITSIGNIYYPPASKLIFKMFRDSADSVRAAAVNALHMYRNHEEAGIRASDFAVPLTDKSDLVRYVTVQALGWEHPGGYPDSTVAGEFLVEALKDGNKFVRIEAIVSLSKNLYRPAVPYLKKMYDTASVDEELAISDAIKIITGEDFPPLE